MTAVRGRGLGGSGSRWYFEASVVIQVASCPNPRPRAPDAHDTIRLSHDHPRRPRRSIRKHYGRTVAVDDVSFEVRQGEIFGLIGPNGAGKTTTMECVEGLRSPDRGAISVLGLDPVRDVYQLQDRIGVQLQEAQLQKRIKVWEAVDLWASLYRKPVDGDRLLEQLGLVEKRTPGS